MKNLDSKILLSIDNLILNTNNKIILCKNLKASLYQKSSLQKELFLFKKIDKLITCYGKQLVLLQELKNMQT